MADKTTVGHSVNVCRDDILQALKTIALKRLREQSPGLEIDPIDWQLNATVFLAQEVQDVQVTLAKD